jgi:hypothetical protein
MDQVRLRVAGEISKSVLGLVDLDDMDHFREGVLKREVIGEIAYAKQRDHSGHTLYNWMLGWYFYDHCRLIRDRMDAEVAKRLLRWPKDPMTTQEFFGFVWQYVSLLHDIGYIFEGNLTRLDLATGSEQSQIGMRITKDYFESRMWLECGFSSSHERKLLLRLAGMELPEFKEGQSMANIADSLRDVGDLQRLCEILDRGLRNGRHPFEQGAAWPTIESGAGLPGDAFDLWILHYQEFEQQDAARRIECIRGAFEAFLFAGMEGLGLRVLDHGVCSGLLMLLISTYYYRLNFGLMRARPYAGAEEALKKRFLKRAVAGGVNEYDTRYWWTAILWGTAACAVHNIQQLDAPWVSPSTPAKKLSVEEDPLAYLGILVDCIEEWDRYFVVPSSVLQGSLPIQGVDVGLFVLNDKIVVDYGQPWRAKKVVGDLNNSLEGWDAIVEIRPPMPKTCP